MKSKIVHIMHSDKFNNEYVNFINQNFNANDHLFIFIVDIVSEKLRAKKENERDGIWVIINQKQNK